MAVQFSVYHDRAGAFRWRLVDSATHRLLSLSLESYTRRTAAIQAVQDIIGDIHRHAHAIADNVTVDPAPES